MSQEALDYVKRDLVVRALPAAEKFLIRQLAMLHDTRVNCAYAFVSTLAEQTMNSPRNCRRLLASLEKKGLILRHASLRDNGSRLSNEYELLGMRVGTAVTEEIRQQVFTTRRTRIAAQLSLSLGVDEAGETNRSCSSAGAETHADGSEDLAVENPEGCPHDPDNCCPEDPGQLVSALDVVLEVSKEVTLSVVFPETHSSGKTSNGNSKDKSANQEQKPKATASAKATATTPVLRSPEAFAESVGETGLSSGRGARVIPFRGRRDAESERAGLDGEDAALFDVAMMVLEECGIAVKNATRRQRAAVGEALREYARREGVSLDAAGAVGINRWKSYLESAWALWRVVGVRQFFAEGYWLENNGHAWDWDKAALAEHRRRL